MNKKDIAKEAIEFLPDALEIEQERLPWYGRIGVAWIFIILAAVIAWACYSEVDVIVRAPGHVVSGHGNIVMKPIESAIIKSIEVKQGDEVTAGQVLITFDPTINQAEVTRLTSEIGALQANFDRLSAEFDSKEYNASATEHEKWQSSIFQQRRKYYSEKVRYFDSNYDRLLASKKSTQESYDKYQEILKNMNEIETMYMNLHKKQVISYKETLEVTMSRMQNEVEVDRLRNQLVEVEHQLLSLLAEKNAFIEEWRDSISEKMVELKRELESNRQQLAKAEQLVSYVQLCAPCHALVLDMASFPVGSAVGEAEAVITLVPLDGIHEIEAEVRPQDISRVKTGSLARIKLTAFPFQKHGTLDGAVRLISGNTFQKQGGMTPDNGRSYYRTMVTVADTRKLRNTGDNFTLIPGMETEVEIKAGRRRIIEYLIYPLIKGLDEAFKEP
ncbi:MAG: HlyD family type I secretion periplasmic adaptor subunit [Victivallales bacterium]|nr:HlyD family type I secretion periplasmic adaptor subunit [Victivallales bacterium]